MTDEEQAWEEDGIGQPPSRNPAASISKALFIIFGVVVAVVVIAALVNG